MADLPYVRVEEARGVLWGIWTRTIGKEALEWVYLERAINAYGAARELRGHIEACTRFDRVAENHPACGTDDWLCVIGEGLKEAER